ncbi:MAG: hypothetical protein MUF15_05595 [Acidobacteria bacterium]|jgi:hypothetical protein|nr:hypothetical protein [Acidobacteriota bacterium]
MQLKKTDIPNDRLIVELENVLAVESLEKTAPGQGANYLKELIFLGHWPYKELRDYINDKVIPTEKLIKKITEQHGIIERFSIHAFVAQPFEGRNDLFFEEIVRPSCYWEKIKPIRVDHMPPEQDLLAKVKTFMKTSHLFIADLTHNDPNVYYEVGYLERTGVPGVFISYGIEESEFYMKYKDIIKIIQGPDGIAACRRRLREALKNIKSSIMTVT